MMTRCFVRAAVAAAGTYLGAQSASAQYAVHEWANFEDGRIPESAILIGADPSKSVSLIEHASVENMAPAYRSSKAVEETGRFGLRLYYPGRQGGPPTVRMAGAVFPRMLDRDTLGSSGRALFQVDLYIPEEYLPNVAVLAMEPPTTGVTRMSQASGAFYRFGCRYTNNDFYFSRIRPGTNADVRADKALRQSAKRPGWHRLALVFEGSEGVRCFLDGKESAISPLRDPTIRKLVVGVVLADTRNDPYYAYVDNLSVQVSLDAPVLPTSPFREATPSSGPATADSQVPADLSQATGWLSPQAAWSMAQRDSKPLLLYFTAPGVRGTSIVDGWLRSDPAARAHLAQHACARIDVNQLSGGQLMEKYQVLKVPTLIVISPDGGKYSKWSYAGESTWSEVAPKLVLKAQQSQ